MGKRKIRRPGRPPWEQRRREKIVEFVHARVLLSDDPMIEGVTVAEMESTMRRRVASRGLHLTKLDAWKLAVTAPDLETHLLRLPDDDLLEVQQSRRRNPDAPAVAFVVAKATEGNGFTVPHALAGGD